MLEVSKLNSWQAQGIVWFRCLVEVNVAVTVTLGLVCLRVWL